MGTRQKEGRLSKLKQLHQSVDCSDETQLELLLQGSEADTVRQLCSSEMKPYGSLLHHAAGIGNVKIMKIILDADVDVDILQMDSNIAQKQTPLHIAALAGKHQSVDLLLSRGANVNAHESEGMNALHCACSGNDVRTVELLLKGGVSVNESDTRGQHPLQQSIMRSSTEITKMILDHGADVKVIDEEGRSVLHYAVVWENEELVNIFLKTGLSPNQQDHEGCTPLHLAEDATIRQILVKHGGDVSVRDNRGQPVIGQQLDMEREEYQRINSLLESRLVPPETTEPSEGRLADIRDKINQMVLPPNEDQASARADLMGELLTKAKPK